MYLQSLGVWIPYKPDESMTDLSSSRENTLTGTIWHLLHVSMRFSHSASFV
jgi:hypothetical protein